MENKEESLINEISGIREEIKSLKVRKAEIVDDIRELKAERRELIEKIKGLRERLKLVRDKLSKLKEERNELLNQRKETVKKIREIKSQLFPKREFLSNSGKKINNISIGKIKSRIDRLEWRIITESLPLEEENAIIKEISRLEALLEKALEAKKLKKEYSELRAELKSQIIILNDLNSKISSLSQTINNLRNEIGKLKEEINGIQDEIEERNKRVQERANELIQINDTLDKLYAKYRDLQEELKNLRIGRRKAIEAKIISGKKQVALKKLEKGERLTFEDLQALYGELSDEDEE